MEDFVSLSTIIRVTCDYLVNYFREKAAENGWTLYWIDKNKYMTWPTIDGEFLLTANKEGECQKPCILSLSIRDFVNFDRDDLLNIYKERLLELGIIKKEEEVAMEDFVRCVVTILNYQLNSGFKVFAEHKKDDLYDIVLIAERSEMGLCWNNRRLLATIDSFDRFNLGQGQIIAKLKTRIAELDPAALQDEFSEAEKEYLEHDKKEVKNLIWHIHVFSVMEEYLNDGYYVSVSYDPGDDDSDGPVYEFYISSEKIGVRWLTSIEESAYTIDNFDKVITKIKNAISLKYPEALKKEETMEEILKDIINALNEKIDKERGYYVYETHLYGDTKAGIYLKKYSHNTHPKLVATVYEGDILFNSNDYLIERLEEKIYDLAPEALKNSDKYVREQIRRALEDLKEEEEMPTSMHDFQFSSIAVVNSIPKVKRVTFSGPATICFFEDGTKTVAKCHDPEKFDKWAGIAICICKKYYGKNFKKYFKEWDGDKELRKLERKEKKARKKMKNVKSYEEVLGDPVMEELWIKEEGDDV